MKEKYKVLFSFNDDLRSLSESVFDEKFYYKTVKQAFLAYSFGKAYKTHASILILCDKGNGQDAAILTRSLFELAVTTLYILDDKSDYRVQRWFDFDWIIRDRMYRYAKSKKYLAEAIIKREEELQKGENTVEEIAQQAVKMQKKYKYDLRKGWSDKTIKQMAEEVGLLDVYKTFYSLQSNLHHSAVRTVNDYFKLEKDGIRADTGPSKSWVTESLVGAFHFFGIVVDKWIEGFNLELGDKLKKLTDRYVVEVGKLQINRRSNA